MKKNMVSKKNKYFMISAICSIVLGALFVFAALEVTITIPNLNLKPGNTGYVTAEVTPVGEHDLIISSEICKDTDGNSKTCEQILTNPCSEISVVFDNTSNNVTTTNANGHADIKITLGANADLGNRYLYYVETDDGGWNEAKAIAQTTSIPEFSTMMIPMFMSLMAFALVFGKKSTGFNF
ncbi:MAG: hypothetical protein KAQ92_07110 [Candidatus Aenigmarchaeota archaeon]|nr:hypothetical protein [Candidatus Aenigmarchaeota archaeon]